VERNSDNGGVTRRQPGCVVVDSVTELDAAAAAGSVVVAGSHAGLYPARLVASLGVRAVILNDASVGFEGAGIAGLASLGSHRIPALAVGHDSARIGDGADCLRRGVVRHLNAAAAACGCAVGQSCAAAVDRLLSASPPRPDAAAPGPAPPREARHRLDAGPPQVWAVDSASLVTDQDAGCILVTGSHGGLLGGRARSAIRAQVLAALFNDAGIGIDNAGISRLPALDDRRIAGATVAAATARIGDGRSTLNDGILSAINALAAEYGIRVGMPARLFVSILHARRDAVGQ
jgi:hypothetical protein